MTGCAGKPIGGLIGLDEGCFRFRSVSRSRGQFRRHSQSVLCSSGRGTQRSTCRTPNVLIITPNQLRRYLASFWAELGFREHAIGAPDPSRSQLALKAPNDLNGTRFSLFHQIVVKCSIATDGRTKTFFTLEGLAVPLIAHWLNGVRPAINDTLVRAPDTGNGDLPGARVYSEPISLSACHALTGGSRSELVIALL